MPHVFAQQNGIQPANITGWEIHFQTFLILAKERNANASALNKQRGGENR